MAGGGGTFGSGGSGLDGGGHSDDKERRRVVSELGLAAAGLGLTAIGASEPEPDDYGLWGVLPVGPYKSKKTIRSTLVPGQLWTFDQKFGILNVQVPIRMAVLRLKGTADGGKGGGLFVYNPVAATRECGRLLRPLIDAYGPVRHVVVGSVALEHKVYAGVFARRFAPDAQVWLQPGQYSFPANLPEPFLGFPLGRTRPVPASVKEAPPEWRESGIDFRTLGPIISRDGAFGETVVYHEPTKTLLVTDTCVQVTDEVPDIYETDPAPLLYHARDTVTDRVERNPETLRKGWKRVVLFGLFFTPSAITIKDVRSALRERRPDINSDFLGVYPWDWTGDEEASWKGLTGTRPGGGPLVAPILQTLLLNRNPVEVLDFADQVSKWDIRRIVPAHLKNNLALTGKEYRAAFGFLEERGVPNGYPRPLKADLQTLLDAEKSLLESGAIAPAPPKVGGPVSRADIIAQTTYNCRSEICTPRADL